VGRRRRPRALALQDVAERGLGVSGRRRSSRRGFPVDRRRPPVRRVRAFRTRRSANAPWLSSRCRPSAIGPRSPGTSAGLYGGVGLVYWASPCPRRTPRSKKAWIPGGEHGWLSDSSVVPGPPSGLACPPSGAYRPRVSPPSVEGPRRVRHLRLGPKGRDAQQGVGGAGVGQPPEDAPPGGKRGWRGRRLRHPWSTSRGGSGPRRSELAATNPALAPGSRIRRRPPVHRSARGRREGTPRRP